MGFGYDGKLLGGLHQILPLRACEFCGRLGKKNVRTRGHGGHQENMSLWINAARQQAQGFYGSIPVLCLCIIAISTP